MGVSWGRSGYMLPLNKYIDHWSGLDSLVPGMMAPDDKTGTIYALPYWLDIRGTVYNKQLFSDSGLDPNTPPAGWPQFETYVKKLTKVHDGVLKQIGLFESWENTGWGDEETYGAYAMQRHTRLFFNSDYTKVMFDQPANVETVQFLASLYQITHPSVTSNEVTDPFNGFYQGKVAMTSGGTWVPSTAIPQDPSWKKNLGFFVGRYSPTTAPAALTYVNGIGISKFSKDPDLAWQFILWLMSPDISPTLNAKSGTVSPIRTLINKYMQAQPELAPWYQATQYAMLWPSFPSAQVGSGYDENALQKALSDVIQGRANAKTALTEVTKAWQGKLDAFRAGK